MFLRAILPAAAAVVLLSAPTAGAQTGPDLAAHVRITAAEGAGFVRVHLPRQIAAHGEHAYDGGVRVRIHGGREMRGIMLRAEEVGGEGWPAGQRPRLGFSTAGDRDVDEVLGAGQPTLPAGDYRLYVYTRGDPVTVDLDFPELSGAQSLALTDGVRMSGGPLVSRTSAGDRAAIGRTFDIGGGDSTVVVVRHYRFAPGQSGFIGSCDHTQGDECPDDGGAPPAAPPSSGESGSTGTHQFTGPVHLNLGILGSSISGPPPTLTGYAHAVEFDVPHPLAAQPPLAAVPAQAPPATSSSPQSAAPTWPVADAVGSVVHRAARVGLTCGSAGPCAGTIRLQRGAPVAFRIIARGRAMVRLPLTRTQRRTLARKRSIRVVLILHVPGQSDVRRTVRIR